MSSSWEQRSRRRSQSHVLCAHALNFADSPASFCDGALTYWTVSVRAIFLNNWKVYSGVQWYGGNHTTYERKLASVQSKTICAPTRWVVCILLKHERLREGQRLYHLFFSFLFRGLPHKIMGLGTLSRSWRRTPSSGNLIRQKIREPRGAANLTSCLDVIPRFSFKFVSIVYRGLVLW